MIDLALASGIPPGVWIDEGEQAIVTAIDLLERAKRRQADDQDDDGRQTSG